MSLHSDFHVAASRRGSRVSLESPWLPLFINSATFHSSGASSVHTPRSGSLPVMLLFLLFRQARPCELAVKHVDYTNYESHESCRL